MTYTPITDHIIEKLISICSPSNVITDGERMESYSHDETSKEQFSAMPEVVVTPSTTEQVAQIMRLADRLTIPVTPRGAGSGLSGGAIPLYGGIVLSLEKMNRIIEIDEENLTVTAEAGIVTNELNERLKDAGLFFAGYPMSLESCFLGGNIAENAGGGKAIKYGVTSRYVLGLKVVTPQGQIVTLGGKVTKDVSSYDLKQLYIGSEGTLGIITEATIKLIGIPKVASTLLVPFTDAQQAISVVPLLMKQGIIPVSIEFMDRLSFEISCDYLNESLPLDGVGAMLLIEVDGSDEAQVEADLIAVGELCEEQGALEVYIAEDANNRERIWAVRRAIAEAIKVYSPIQSLEDVVVPIASIPRVLPFLEELSAHYRLKIPCYGHAGDGNLHATVVKDPDWTMDKWLETEPKILGELYTFIVDELGGKISGEHGIGVKRREFVKELTAKAEYELLKTLKQAFDPKGIMNPGKILI
ncbi:MAG: FAD-binding oxidoreductase [Sphaerochaeta sp.]|jgi:glycolate oxidase|nr:FAD-binding oxidoreductase [Sphaerochaeta sp.]